MAEKQMFIQVRGQDSLESMSPLWSNFLALSRVGTDVQLEFVFLDLAQVAQLAERAKKGEAADPEPITGRTVAKIVMPGYAFVHIRDHLQTVLDALAVALQAVEGVQK